MAISSPRRAFPLLIAVIALCCGTASADKSSARNAVALHSGTSEIIVLYRRETDNYNVPVSPALLAKIYTAEVRVDRAAKVSDIVHAVKTIRIVGVYNGALDAVWQLLLIQNHRAAVFSFDRTLKHAYIGDRKYVINDSFSSWIIRRFGCLRATMLHST